MSAPAERFFWRLLTCTDDFGRVEGDPRVLLAQTFPLRIGRLKPRHVAAWLQELVEAGLLIIYQVADHPYGQFNGHETGWTKHQRLRAKHSKYPSPLSSDNICQQPLSSADKCGRSRSSESEARVNPEAGGGVRGGTNAGPPPASVDPAAAHPQLELARQVRKAVAKGDHP